ncbi:DMSO/selenate family reductase complex B subunit [Desulfitobacterium sp. AusDCA]|uniref:DMSO/selenate family reductase complex B subunit n=1 Tax=Desulfitobacterium sp. AusDCA TaxID=3240383 RepID=UPI003DA74426
MSQWGFYIDMTACTGCKTCQIACKDKNNLEAGVLFRRVKYFEGGKFPETWTYNISISCNHCENPKCVKNCPTGAMHKVENGIVLPDKDKCIGCRMCTLSCPYSQPQYFKEEGKVSKCNFCIDLINQNEDPACVAACPMRAIHYGPLDDLRKKYGEGSSKVRGLPDSSITQPSLIINAKKEAIIN